jgi:ABC-type nitrate/sulfonate/bicarbonate transport system substrate-binding protein
VALAILAAGALLAAGSGPALGDTALTLGWQSPGGGLALEAAIRNGFFKEEGIEATAVRIPAEEFTEGVSSGRIVAGELDGSVLALYRDGAAIGPSAGLYSGFLEIFGRKTQPEKIRLAVESKGSGPAVAAARHYRTSGTDPDTAVEWVETGPDGLFKALQDDKASAFARWETRRAAPSGAHGSGSGNPPAHGGGQSHGDQAGKPQGHGPNGENCEPPAQGGGHGQGPKGENPDPQAQGHAHGQAAPPGGPQGHPEGHASGQHGSQLCDCETLYSASASLPPPSTDGSAPANPHAAHTAAHHFFTSFVVLTRGLYESDPALAAAVTRAWIRGAAWVGEHPDEAAKAGIEAKVWDKDQESLKREIERYMWMPGVTHAKEHVKAYIHEWIGRGLLPAGTDEGAFFNGLFIQALPDLN